MNNTKYLQTDQNKEVPLPFNEIIIKKNPIHNFQNPPLNIFDNQINLEFNEQRPKEPVGIIDFNDSD